MVRPQCCLQPVPVNLLRQMIVAVLAGRHQPLPHFPRDFDRRWVGTDMLGHKHLL
jgi:hypothetical protein